MLPEQQRTQRLWLVSDASRISSRLNLHFEVPLRCSGPTPPKAVSFLLVFFTLQLKRYCFDALWTLFAALSFVC